MITVTEFFTRAPISIAVPMIGMIRRPTTPPGNSGIDQVAYLRGAHLTTMTGSQIAIVESPNEIKGLIFIEEANSARTFNRIGDRCWFKLKGEWRHGTLRHWSTDHQEYDNGPGHVPVGIVEDLQHATMHSIYVDLISFDSMCPQ